MPTYDYECTRCGTVFELFQSIKEPPRKRLRKTDPHACGCDAPVSRRIGTGAGILFKGSGFYVTDYRSESYKQAAKAESGGGTEKAPATGETKKESTNAPSSAGKAESPKSGKEKSVKAKE